jgi:hypothetical protein
MRSREDKIKLLEKVIKGELPASVLKTYTVTYFREMTPDQRGRLEAINGKVSPANCSIYNPNERLIALWNGISIGVTALFHLSMFAHPESDVKMVDCRDSRTFDKFLQTLTQKHVNYENIKPRGASAAGH